MPGRKSLMRVCYFTEVLGSVSVYVQEL